MRRASLYLGLLSSLGCTAPVVSTQVTGPEAETPTQAPAAEAPAAEVVKAETTAKPVRLHLFLMSQCPHCARFVKTFREAVAPFGPDVEIDIGFVGSIDDDGDLRSMHGAREVWGDLLEVCAQSLTAAAPSHAALDFTACLYEDFERLDDRWRGCAKDVGIEARTLERCAWGPDGKRLLSASFQRSRDLAISGTPTLLVEQSTYEGARRRTAMRREICAAFDGQKPAACDAPPAGPPINLVALVDGRCDDCEKDSVVGLSQRFENPVVSEVDVSTAAGKKLFDSLAPVRLPAVVFDATLDLDDEGKRSLSRSLKSRGDTRFVSIGDWDPRCVNRGGCDIAECKPNPVCRKEKPKKLELFIMSQCPYGAKAIAGLQGALDHFKKNGATVDLSVNYIGTGSAKSGFQSMHGKSEVEEDLRQVCAIAHYGKSQRFMKYLACRAKDYKSDDWEACTGKSTAIDAKVLEKCAEGEEGKRLLEASFSFTDASRKHASPSWFVNGIHSFSGNDTATIKANICAHNDLPGCDSEPPPTRATPTPTGDASCGD